MEKLLKTQLKNSKLLLQSLSVVNSLDDPRVEDLMNNLAALLFTAEKSLQRKSDLLNRKQACSDRIEELANQFTILALRAEGVHQYILPADSNENPFENGTEDGNGSYNGRNFLDVSPCPSTWENGALATPRPVEAKTNGHKTIAWIEQMNTKELTSVPSYMKGRLTSEVVNTFIGTVNSVLKKKYSIVNLKRREVKHKDIIQYISWKNQEQEFKMKGQLFFTGEDLMTLANFKLDKTADKIIQVLRHTNRLKQTTVTGKVVVYSLLNK